MSEYNKKNILIADDDDSFRFTIKEYFSDSPWEIDFAENGVVALDKALAKKYDLIILDINMPFMKGSEALKSIKNVWPDLNIIAFTAISNIEEQKKFFDIGFDDIISKPTSLELLHKKILKFFIPELTPDKSKLHSDQKSSSGSENNIFQPKKSNAQVQTQNNIPSPLSTMSASELQKQSREFLLEYIKNLEDQKIILNQKLKEYLTAD